MKTINVNSSHVASVAYDAKTQVLTVNYLNGRVYKYSAVSNLVFDEITNVSANGESVGRYLRDHVYGEYNCTREI